MDGAATGALADARLRLEPLTGEMARAILAGDLSGLAAAALTTNAPSRRVLEKAGFQYLGLDEGEALYQRP